MAEPHPVYPGGPPCTDSCPGAWSSYHDGYSWGYEKGQQDRAAPQSEAVAPERGTDLTNLAARLAATPAPVVPDSTEPGGEG